MEEKETKKVEYDEKEILSVKLDFDQLDKWFNEKDHLPICSFISLYDACGIKQAVADYSAAHNNAKVVPVDNILCSFYTLQHLKNYISNQWAIYSLDIDGDNHVFWDTKKYPVGAKHYARTLKKKVKASLEQDFANYCCGLDDELPDDVIVFKVYEVKTNEKIDANEKTDDSVK